MVLLLAEDNDVQTNNIIDWLNYFGEKFIRINYGEKITTINISINNDNNAVVYLKYQDTFFYLHEIKGYWLWRSYFVYSSRNTLPQNDPIISYLIFESEHISDFVHREFERRIKNKIANIDTIVANKLEILSAASDFHINIPPTLVSNDKAIILDFLITHGDVIVKAINAGFNGKYGTGRYLQYTSKIKKEDVCRLPTDLFPCIFQKEIKKKYELRVFFFEDKFYAMSIFSQKNALSKVDSRRFENIVPRTTPYKLPADIEMKLKLLFNYLKLYTGSADLIVSEDNKFYFLEINPVGQYGMVSLSCNYHIEKIVVEYLIR